jgi:hypothetical protein
VDIYLVDPLELDFRVFRRLEEIRLQLQNSRRFQERVEEETRKLQERLAPLERLEEEHRAEVRRAVLDQPPYRRASRRAGKI